ncbi:Hypothetical protein KLENKIAIHU_2733 [Klenkia terrae]|nr:Hypothetical protein KLENKIAIHU_2733 [Klenkia terrae]
MAQNAEATVDPPCTGGWIFRTADHTVLTAFSVPTASGLGNPPASRTSKTSSSCCPTRSAQGCAPATASMAYRWIALGLPS